MTTFKDIPQAQDQRNQSQSDILNNMRYLLNVSSPANITGILPVDHQASGDNSSTPQDGFHKQVSYLTQAPIASLVNSVNSQSSQGITYVSPDNLTPTSEQQLYHYTGTHTYQITPCIPLRASVNFTGVTSNGAAPINGTAFNVTSVTRTGQGIYQFHFTNTLPSANYMVYSSAMRRISAGLVVANPQFIAAGSPLPTQDLIMEYAPLGANFEDPGVSWLMIFGG